MLVGVIFNLFVSTIPLVDRGYMPVQHACLDDIRIIGSTSGVLMNWSKHGNLDHIGVIKLINLMIRHSLKRIL